MNFSSNAVKVQNQYANETETGFKKFLLKPEYTFE